MHDPKKGISLGEKFHFGDSALNKTGQTPPPCTTKSYMVAPWMVDRGIQLISWRIFLAKANAKTRSWIHMMFIDFLHLLHLKKICLSFL